MLRELWWGLSVCGFTALAAGTVLVCGARLVDWPADPPAPGPDRQAQWVREERDRLEAELLRERAAHLTTRVELDALRRNAIWFPKRDELLPAGDMIPPQAVPVVPAGHRE